MAQFFHFFPTFASCPFVRMFGIHGAGCVQVAIGFLCCSYDGQYAVNVFLQFFVRISLKQITGSFNGFVNICIIERITAYLDGIAGMGCHFEIPVPPGLFAFTECKRDGHFTARFQALSPKRVCYLHRSKRDRVNGIAVCCLLLCVCASAYHCEEHRRNH